MIKGLVSVLAHVPMIHARGSTSDARDQCVADPIMATTSSTEATGELTTHANGRRRCVSCGEELAHVRLQGSVMAYTTEYR